MIFNFQNLFCLMLIGLSILISITLIKYIEKYYAENMISISRSNDELFVRPSDTKIMIPQNIIIGSNYNDYNNYVGAYNIEFSLI